MSINKQIYNIFSKNLVTSNLSKANILYELSNSLLDKALLYSDKFNLISNQIYNISPISCNGIIINDPLSFTNNLNRYNEFIFTKKILFFQNKPPIFFKKEDLSIFADNVKSCVCVGLNQHTSLWNIKNMVFMDYGVPKLLFDQSLKYKSKDILIYNIKNSNIASSIYQQVNNSFPSLSVDMLTDQTLSLKDQINLISDYRLVIDTDNTYNQLVSLCCGSMVIAAQKNIDNEFLYEYNFSKDILENIPKILNKYHRENLEDNATKLIKSYDFSRFENNLLNILLS